MALPELTEDVKQFLEDEVFPKMGIKKLTSRNRYDVLQFIELHYEISLSEDEDEGKQIDQAKLDLASKTVDQLNDVK